MKPSQATVWMLAMIIGLATSITATLAEIVNYQRDSQPMMLNEDGERNDYFKEKYDKGSEGEDNFRFPFFFLENKMKIIKHNRRQAYDGMEPSYSSSNTALNNNNNNNNNIITNDINSNSMINSINNYKYTDSTNDDYAKSLNGLLTMPNMKQQKMKQQQSTAQDDEVNKQTHPKMVYNEMKKYKGSNRWSDWHDMSIDLASSDTNTVSGNMYAAQKYPTKTRPSGATKRSSKIQRLPIVVKRFGSFPVNHPSSSTNNNSSAVGSTKGAARQNKQRRRRIKTLLPVGLSSWFLGGIRALDGRHWHLPAEVINRLAVNDVDFNNHSRTFPQIDSPGAGNIVMLLKPPPSNVIRPGQMSTVSSTAQSRPQTHIPSVLSPNGDIPNRQLIPR